MCIKHTLYPALVILYFQVCYILLKYFYINTIPISADGTVGWLEVVMIGCM